MPIYPSSCLRRRVETGNSLILIYSSPLSLEAPKGDVLSIRNTYIWQTVSLFWPSFLQITPKLKRKYWGKKHRRKGVGVSVYELFPFWIPFCGSMFALLHPLITSFYVYFKSIIVRSVCIITSTCLGKILIIRPGPTDGFTFSIFENVISKSY